MPNHKPLDATFTIQIEMKSDWHIGSGAGRPGDVDRLVRRDEDGLPFIPAKTLIGIWRDACERAALGLDDGKPGGWSQWIPFLFGDQAGQLDEDSPDLDDEGKRLRNQKLILPRPAIISVRSARLPETLREAIKGQPTANDAVTFVKPGIAIDPRSGRAKDEFLRFEELARGGVTLTAGCRINWAGCNEVQQQTATALLLAGAKLVERIGAKRRRGAGQCEMTVAGSGELTNCWNWIEALNGAAPDAPPPVVTPDDFVLTPNATQDADDWVCIDLVIETKAPVIISEQTIGNLVKTLDYIPGTYLLPIIRRALKDKLDVNSAIFSGNLTVTNATIEVAGTPGRPVPFALFHEKVGGGLKLGCGVYNRLQEPAPSSPQLKGHRAGYIGTSPIKTDELPAFKTVRLEVEPHNVVEDKFQRPTEAVGGVYSYQVIAKGSKLRAQLRVRQSLLPQADKNWFTALDGGHSIGRSKKDDYGAVCVKASAADGNETPTVQNNELTVWLLSDLLLRDERLRPTASVKRLAEVLGKELDVTLHPRKSSEQKMAQVSRQHRTDSWHVGWGLPRPSLVGLAAGTCFVFYVTGTLTETKLTRVEATGLGERRAEGYGRLCFNDPLLTTEAKGRKRVDIASKDNPTPKPVKQGNPSFDYARLIEREAARKEIQRCAIGVAAQPDQRKLALGIFVKPAENGGKPKSQPQMSQLGALRSIVTRLQSKADDEQHTKEKDQVIKWLEQIEDTENRSKKWPGGEGDEEHSLSKIRNLITNAECVWATLGVSFDQIALTENGAASLKVELWAEAVRTLVDACARAQKRATEPEEGGK